MCHHESFCAQIHHNAIHKGKIGSIKDRELRMNHYWGARLQNWGEDTAEILAMTEEDMGMELIVRAFKECEKYIRPYLD